MSPASTDLTLPDDLDALAAGESTEPPDDLTVACYTCPLWHPSALFADQYAPGWSEYVLMRGGRPWFPGHHQPRQPLLGELDERDPGTWSVYNELAKAHGIDVFIWDFYWYDRQPALHEALEDGFLRSQNRDGLQFAVMWTNHPWITLFPTVHPDGTRSFPHFRDAPDELHDVWQSMTYVISRYFQQPNYWRIDGKPVLVIWDPVRLTRLFGVDGTRRLLDELRAFAAKLGHGGIHLHHDCTMEVAMNPDAFEREIENVADLGFDTYGLYNPIVLTASRRPAAEVIPSYGVVAADVVRDLWPTLDRLSPLPFWPAVSPGWDAAPRHNELPRSSRRDRNEWPGALVVADESPGAFESLVRASFAALNARGGAPHVLTIGCWNEWTEGQYVLPDTRLGYGMLRALARALGRPVSERFYASPAGDPWPGPSGHGPVLRPAEPGSRLAP